MERGVDAEGHVCMLDQSGYMPLRGDFDVEHDNEAELLLADMELDPEADDPAELQLKLDVIDVYNRHEQQQQPHHHQPAGRQAGRRCVCGAHRVGLVCVGWLLLLLLRKLDERERRKEFAKTHGLIDYRR